MFELEIIIKDLPLTRNAIADRRWTRKKEADKWTELIRLCISDRPETPLEKAQLHLIRHSSSCPDYDGLVGSFKYPIDALVRLGIIKDDNMRVIKDPKYEWEKTKRGQGFITMRVYEVS